MYPLMSYWLFVVLYLKFYLTVKEDKALDILQKILDKYLPLLYWLSKILHFKSSLTMREK